MTTRLPTADRRPPVSRVRSPLIPTARDMRRAGKTFREIGRTLGVSGARVHQWLRPAGARVTARRSARTRAILDALDAVPPDSRAWQVVGRFGSRRALHGWLRTYRPGLPGWEFCGRQDARGFGLYARRTTTGGS